MFVSKSVLLSNLIIDYNINTELLKFTSLKVLKQFTPTLNPLKITSGIFL